MTANYRVIGQSVRRLDAVEKVTGTAPFTTDIKLPGMLYAKVLRSPYPHARIIDIDTSEAEKLPGVKAVATYKNTPQTLFNGAAGSILTLPPSEPIKDQRIFSPIVRYVGDEVAAVAATSEEIAAEALKLIKVNFEPLPTVYDPLAALEEKAPDVHDNCREGKNITGNAIHLGLGDIDQGLAEADFIVEEQFKVPVQKQAQLETQAAVAQVTPDGKVTVWSTTQTPHPTRIILSNIFSLPQSKIRVLNPPYVGGGFGVRIGLSGKAEPIAVALALKSGRPVQVVYSREEDFIASDTRHAGYITVKLGAKKDGTFTALDVLATLNTGAYASWGMEAPAVLGCMGFAIYRVPHQKYVGFSVYTNTTPAGAARGFGNPQGCFAIESAVDMMAAKLGLDPAEIRLKNIMQVGDKWVLPYECKSTGLAECITKGTKALGWERRGKLNSPGAKKLRGLGLAVGTHCSNAWPWFGDYSNAYLTIQQDGSVLLATGVPDLGTGTSTTLPQIAAEALGVKLTDIGITFGDTESTPFEIGSHASRTCYASGTAVVAAAKDVRQQVLTYAAEMLNLPVNSLDMQDSLIFCSDAPDKETTQLTLQKVAAEAHFKNKQFIGVGRIIPENAPPWHAHLAEVEVDTQTGQVTVTKIVAAHDVGKAIHPVVVEGQIQGGALQGMGYALSEEVKYDAKGRQVHNTFGKYMLPTAEDTPEMDVIIVESHDPTGPFGAKGVGECGMVPTAPAIANAVYDATGIRFTEIPLTPERVYQALQRNSK